MTERHAPEIAELFSPHEVVAIEVTGGADPSTLLPEEHALIEAASPERRREFAAGRLAARLAVEALGFAPEPIGRTTRRAPKWPAGVHGSIAHTADQALAVVTTAQLGIGIDLERLGRVSARVAQRICTPDELRRLEALDAQGRERLATKIFGAKEAFYKAQYQLTEAFLGFDAMTSEPVDDELRLFSAVTDETTAQLVLPTSARFLEHGEFLISAVTVARSATTSP